VAVSAFNGKSNQQSLPIAIDQSQSTTLLTRDEYELNQHINILTINEFT